MKRYIRIYKTLLKLNYIRFTIYRIDFLNGLISSLLWAAFSIITIYALTSKSSSVFGWSREELFILIGVFNIMIGGLFRMYFSKNFDRFAQIIQRGELDGLLLKPLDSQFSLSFWYISFYGVVRVVAAVIFTFYMLQQTGIGLTFLTLLQFIALGFLGLTILYSLWFIVLTITIWHPDLNNLVETLYAVDTLTRYPPQILNEFKILIFYVLLPFTLVVSIPTKALLQKATFFDMSLIIIVAFGLLYFSRRFWKFALRYYTSASG